jgi:hypothetical protein
MSKNVVWALLILAGCVLVFIFSGGSMSLNLVFTKVHPSVPLGLFIFTALGVIVGLLLK